MEVGTLWKAVFWAVEIFAVQVEKIYETHKTSSHLIFSDQFYLVAITWRKIVASLWIIMTETNVTCLQDIEEIAIKSLPRNALDYYRSGANHMSTLKENKTAFQKWGLFFVFLIIGYI